MQQIQTQEKPIRRRLHGVSEIILQFSPEEINRFKLLAQAAALADKFIPVDVRISREHLYTINCAQ